MTEWKVKTLALRRKEPILVLAISWLKVIEAYKSYRYMAGYDLVAAC